MIFLKQEQQVSHDSENQNFFNFSLINFTYFEHYFINLIFFSNLIFIFLFE